MKHLMILAAALVSCVMIAGPAQAQGTFKIETGRAFNRAVPKDFVLEGNAIPTEKRNAALLKTPSGARLLVGLIDTAGYSSRVQQKYVGMMITEGQVEVCGKSVAIGSYGFGLEKGTGHSAEFMLYNQAGEKVASCQTDWDAKLARPTPLHVTVNGNGSARLYLGRNWIELK